ncbi:MAG: DUF58 domain-containing protein [Gammaproteobacteria bacterium]
MTGAVAADATQRLDRRRVYIFPSRAGFTFGAMFVIILLGAINYDNALGYLLAFLLGGMVMVAMLHTYHNLAGLEFHGARADPVFAGERAVFTCLLGNPWPRARLALALKRWPRGASRGERRELSANAATLDLAPDASASVPITVNATRRGWLTLGRLALDSTYPLGILRAWAYFASDARCLVYPAPRGTLPLPHTTVPASGAGGVETSGVDEFAGLRPYAAGDPMRAIAWKTLAREQELMVKRFHGRGAAELRLDWAAVATLGEVEDKLAQLTAWVLEADRRGARYALALPDAVIPRGQGPAHRDSCLRALALYGLGK